MVENEIVKVIIKMFAINFLCLFVFSKYIIKNMNILRWL